ncbi:MAG: N-acetyl-gamma-glutamyl-phosphate reductase [Pirellulaceae bacterium]|nr:N-acetyl-gamma-glutamyl-phosphate reductase [Pirellulaceae bacterium]
MIRVGVVGATGYTALELLKLLIPHPEVEIAALTSRQEGRPHISSVHRSLTNQLDLHLEQFTAAQLAEQCDCVFSCLPHAASAKIVAQLLAAGTRVVDFSADYRLNDLELYETWYDTKHPDPARLGSTPYGLPEWFREGIEAAQLVANPGCYPTSAIMAMGPFLKSQRVEDTDLIFDSKSGVSGAGRNPKLATHFPECNESFSAYGVGSHRHTPEITQVLSTIATRPVKLVFTPHLVPMDRGILTTAYAKIREPLTDASAIACLHEQYDQCPFVRVVDHLPTTKDTSFTNYCDITARVVGERLIVVCSIDNLLKGASGAAVQNMNLMFGLSETTGF